MTYLLLFFIVVLLSAVLGLVLQNARIKKRHLQNIGRLQQIIDALHSRQEQLNEKVLITSEYRQNYLRDMKALGDEVFELQKVFIDIISNRNYK